MKRIFILLVGAMFLFGGIAWAEESVLIDFSLLIADSEEFPGENEQTLLDLRHVPIAALPEEEREDMRSSLAIENWEVRLASSSRTVNTMQHSFTREAVVREEAERFAGEPVMGVRVRFPEGRFNSWALIQPPFEIPSFDEEDRFGDGYGVVRNVGTIRQIRANVFGLNYPHRISAIVMDQDRNVKEVMLGHLEYDGWDTIGWNNPNYVEDVRNRELEVMPLYPRTAPMRKVVGFRIYRDGDDPGGDFVTYLKDLTLVYDLAQPDIEPDIDHEEIWGILDARESERRRREMSRMGRTQALRMLEERLMDTTLDDVEDGEVIQIQQ